MFRFNGYERWASLGLLALVFFLPGLVGCGGKKNGIVLGKVTYKGQPLGNGTVVFIGADNQGGSSPIAPDGTYKVVNAPSGSVTITVESNPPPPRANTVNMPKMPEMPGMPKQPEAGKYVRIPDKYRNPKQSGLTYTVQSGKQTHDIVLE